MQMLNPHIQRIGPTSDFKIELIEPGTMQLNNDYASNHHPFKLKEKTVTE